MRTTLCICLLTLGVMMLFCESEGIGIGIPNDCCHPQTLKKAWQIKGCYEQNLKGCPGAFLIVTSSGEWKCLKPNLRWLKREINEGTLKCRPLISKVKQRFEDLDEVDLE